MKIFLSLLILLCSIFCHAADNKSFTIVVPSFNNREWVKRNLDSIISQSYDPFKIIYIDDASSDGTGDLVQEYIQKNSLHERMTLLRNEKQEEPLLNLHHAAQLCSSDDIIVLVQGCDWLAHRDVLTQLNSIYADPNIWHTMGRHCSYPSYSSENTTPDFSFKTFYANLVGQAMLPLEDTHIASIQDIHYIYNTRSKPQTAPKKIYITPGLWGELFSINNPIFNRDNCLDVMYRLREEAKLAGYEICQADDLESLTDFEYLIVFDVFLDQLPALSRFPKEKKILFLWEPPSVLPENYNLENHRSFSKVYTWHDGLVDNQKYFKFFYPVIHPMIEDTIDFKSKKLCTLISCNKESNYPEELYSERVKLIHFFENGPYDGFTLFGKWWPQTYKTYAGSIDKKVDCLKNFRFCFAYENIKNIPGYITEKIFDSFQAGTVPIYWGAQNISDYIPKDCYLLREDFSSNEALYSYIKNMNEEQYQTYIENIRAFLAGNEAKRYSKEHFISLFLKLISTPTTHIPNVSQKSAARQLSIPPSGQLLRNVRYN